VTLSVTSNKVWISDTHYHNFERFSTVNKHGINTRLQAIIDATKEATLAAKKQGITVMIHGGDCFHVRGKISPTVLNPVIELYRWIIEECGMRVVMIAGNHDLESKEASDLTNTASALASVGVEIINQTTIDEELQCVFAPWHSSLSDLKQQLSDCATKLDKDVNNYTAVIHAPLNGVIAGIPSHGLDSSDLAKYGYKRIMCGHYHNHVDFGTVVSIGALTHQTFGDIHSKAGFVIERDGELSHHVTSAPRFVDLEHEDPTDQTEFEECVNGHYVRVKLSDASETELADMRQDLTNAGALGSLITNIPSTTKTTKRTGTTASGVSMESSVSTWVKGRGFPDHVDEIERNAVALLKEL
jgi:DNA repair exonuclease SbcCD nuclease subunit